MRRRKRLHNEMDCDSSEGCKKCGILCEASALKVVNGKELCRACGCIEAADRACQTPCGQQYCNRCGFLLLASASAQNLDHCLACTSLLLSYIQPGDFRKAVLQKCDCEFCCNPHSRRSPSPQKKWANGDLDRLKVSFHQRTNLQPTTANHNAFVPADKDNQVEDAIRNKWEREQLELKKRLLTEDCSGVKKVLQSLNQPPADQVFYVGGVDISFIKGNSVDACAALTIVSLPDLQLVYKRLEMVELTAPYIPGFLAFREVEFLVQLYGAMLKNAPQYKPHVILVDGNGQLHPRGFGLACHLGVLLQRPCVGVGKTLIHVDGIEDNDAHKARKLTLKKAGDWFPLTTEGGETLGRALRSTDSAANPIYVSVGHMISLQSATTIVQHCCKYRVPEPTRLADLHSRQYLEGTNRSPEEFIASDD